MKKEYPRYVSNNTGDVYNLTYDDGKEVVLKKSGNGHHQKVLTHGALKMWYSRILT